jgi:high-affinity Fe2+/Pb2+ permease
MHVEEMSEREERVVSTLGRIGFLALAVVFAVIGWFLVKAAVQFDPYDAVSVGGALGRSARLDYGKFLLGLVAAGLFVYGLFGFVQARYQKAWARARRSGRHASFSAERALSGGSQDHSARRGRCSEHRSLAPALLKRKAAVRGCPRRLPL